MPIVKLIFWVKLLAPIKTAIFNFLVFLRFLAKDTPLWIYSLLSISNKQNLKNVNQTLLNRPLKSLDSYTSKQVFVNVFDEDLFNKLF